MAGRLDATMTDRKARGTYVYAVVAAPRRPSAGGRPRGLDGAGPVRLLELTVPEGRLRPRRSLKRWVAVADVPLARYGSETINARLGDIEWVSRAAVAHEAVVESFIGSRAVLPMKLFTIFTSDERAVAHLAARSSEIDAVLKRVVAHDEWGVRVLVDGSPLPTAVPAAGSRRPAASGVSYLAGKKRQRDAVVERAARASETVQVLYESLARRATLARRRAASELPAAPSRLALDAVFLVRRSRASGFRNHARREARRLNPLGYQVSLTGPWPPYSFVSR
jgi:hypothetical protein